jgi:hypothetical protein
MVRSEGNMSLKNPVTPLEIDPETVRLVAQCLNHYATPGPEKYILLLCIPHRERIWLPLAEISSYCEQRQKHIDRQWGQSAEM